MIIEVLLGSYLCEASDGVLARIVCCAHQVRVVASDRSWGGVRGDSSRLRMKKLLFVTDVDDVPFAPLPHARDEAATHGNDAENVRVQNLGEG